ncbi:MAG TPA: glycosyl transferase family protein [Allosphingosinicella sp.]
MDWTSGFIGISALVVRELTLFAAVGFIFLGVGDVAVDLAWLALRAKRLLLRVKPASVASLSAPARPGRLVVFVPAWQEADVVGPMLRHALRQFDHDDYLIYVGCYPNDPATAKAVRAVADPRVRAVVGWKPGPTTKADCLNAIWDALRADEAAEGWRAKAVVLHDAEDVVHSAELRLFDSLIERFDLIQLPVLPLIDRRSRWIAGHYGDEFAEAHGKEMVVREALGAGLPSAGVGCAISRDALEALAEPAGTPFDAASLTEDYELGLRLRAMGRRSAFVRLPADSGGVAVATREHFPATLDAAVSQKARWMVGIALSGWDRLGWGGGLAERWMRLRDRQSPLAALLLCAAYAALLTTAPLAAVAAATGHEVQLLTPTLAALSLAAMVLLLWRLAIRFAFVTAAYGWREGLRSVPRILVGNAIAMLAARRAVGRYLLARRSGRAAWEKTRHIFPAQVPAE